jgi:hypothetical protein
MSLSFILQRVLSLGLKELTACFFPSPPQENNNEAMPSMHKPLNRRIKTGFLKK